MSAPTGRPDPLEFLADGGEMAELIRSVDWSGTPLGPPASWPQSLKIIIRVMLGSRYAMWLGWGPEFTFFYNDAYARMTLGPKHPWALGRSAREVWAEIWSDIGPRAESVVRTGVATWDEGLLLFLERLGFPEETYHTFSYSPVPADGGGVGGMLCVVTEDTERTLAERRLQTLRELAARTNDQARSAEEACQTAASILAENARDVPFALLYLLSADPARAVLVGRSGLEGQAAACPDVIDLSDRAAVWPLWRSMASSQRELVDLSSPSSVSIRHPHWPDHLRHAVIVPIAKPGQTDAAGFLVAGVSPRRPFDASYGGFFDLVAGQVATAVANARAYEEEKRRAEALAQIDRAKTAFFSNVSHEFRTPLTLLLGPLQDALSSVHGPLPRPAADDLAMAHRNALRLQRLVNALLDFSRIEAGRVQATFEPVDLAAFTAELASSFRSAIEKAGMRLVVECPPLPQPVHVDRDMWEKIVLNLVSNAFKYTLEGEIRVSLRPAGGSAELSVSDTGTGIPQSAMPRLFERFYRVEGAQGRTHEGTGIGLALVSELVKFHGGSVRAQSQVGEGSTFTVSIPLGIDHLPKDRIRARQAPPAPPAPGVARAFLGEAMGWLGDDAAAEVDPLPPAGANPGPRTTIVLADDNTDMRRYIERLLSGRYRVVAVSNGREALAAIDRERPDLVLTDVMMPKLDGMGLLRAIRENEATAALPVIMLSARAGEEARIEGLERGADDYVVKPFAARELLARVESQITLARVRRESERSIRRSEEQFRAFVTASSDIVYRMSPDWRTVRHLRGREFIAQTPEPDQSWLERYILPADRPAVARAISHAIDTRSTFELEHRVARPDGSIGWTFTRAIPLLDDRGQIVEWFGAASDVTDRKRAEEALRASEERFAFVRRTSGVGFWYCDLPFDELEWDEHVKAHFHLPPEARVTIQTFYERIHPADREPTRLAIEQSITQRAPYDVDYRTVDPNTRAEKWIRAIGRTFYAKDGSPIRFDGVTIDITGRKRAEEALRSSRERYHALATASSDVAYAMSADWSLLLPLDGRGLVASNTEPIRDWLTRNIPPEEHARVQDAVARAIATKSLFELEHRVIRPDGSIGWTRSRAVPILDNDGNIVEWFGAASDITDRKRSEEALQASERRFKTMANAAPAMLWITEPDSSCSFLSRGWFEYTGQTEQEGLGAGWLQAVHPDDRPEAARVFLAANARHEPFDLNHRLRRADGAYRWVIDSGRPRFDEHGTYLGYIGSVIDVHERAVAEQALARHRDDLEETVRQRTSDLEASHRRLRLAERMASLGTLSAGLGHDMGNLLLPIRIRLESLAQGALTDAAREDVKAIRTSADYLQKLANGLRLLALDPDRVQPGEVSELGPWWADAQGVFRGVLPRGVLLECHLPQEDCAVAMAKAALTQAVFNLVQNAGDAMRERGSGVVTIRAVCEPERVRLSVSDNGPGMSEETRQRCMEPFYSTKPRGISTGLGLVLVYGLTSDAGGTVELESHLGKGTTFTLSLPRVAPAGGQGDAAPRSAALRLSDPRLRSFVAAELSALAFRVTDPDEAPHAELFVIDSPEALSRAPEGSKVVFLGQAPPQPRKQVRSLGDRPQVSLIRSAIRELTGRVRLGAASPPGEARGAQ